MIWFRYEIDHTYCLLVLYIYFVPSQQIFSCPSFRNSCELSASYLGNGDNMAGL